MKKDARFRAPLLSFKRFNAVRVGKNGGRHVLAEPEIPGNYCPAYTSVET